MHEAAGGVCATEQLKGLPVIARAGVVNDARRKELLDGAPVMLAGISKPARCVQRFLP
jgi:hypothetical protein